MVEFFREGARSLQYVDRLLALASRFLKVPFQILERWDPELVDSLGRHVRLEAPSGRS